MIKELKSLKINNKVLREFGLLVGGIFLLLGGISLWRDGSHFAFFFIAGTALVLPALVFPRSLKPVYYLWMALGLMLGEVVSRVILSIVFLFVLTPIAVVMRAAGQRFLETKTSGDKATYWVPRPVGRPKESYRKQY